MGTAEKTAKPEAQLASLCPPGTHRLCPWTCGSEKMVEMGFCLLPRESVPTIFAHTKPRGRRLFVWWPEEQREKLAHKDAEIRLDQEDAIVSDPD